MDREPARVLEDVVDEWISLERARDTYGVILSGDPKRWETLQVDEQATTKERNRRRESGQRGAEYRQAQAPLRWWVDADLRGAFVP